MNLTRALLAGGLLLASVSARAVYAPIPEQDLGKDFVVSLRSGLSYDTNLFAAAFKNVESSVFTLAPKADYKGSLNSQTFLAASYELTYDHFDNRPGEKNLFGHEAMLRGAHSFRAGTTLDVLDVFQATRNPESLLNGLPVNSDQSNNRNEVDATFTTAPNAKTGLTAKARSIVLRYRDAAVGRALDHIENLYGLSGSYAVLPEVKAVGEFRHQDVFYREVGETKNKHSEYAMGGVDYAFAKKLAASARAGAEWRHRDGVGSTTGPYAELTAKYDYTESSYLTGGYVYNLEETSDPARFTDTRVNRLFISVQHHLTPLIVASTTITREFSVLLGRPGQIDLDENILHGGGALSYLPTKHWTISGTYDADVTKSDDRARSVTRHRVGVSATLAF